MTASILADFAEMGVYLQQMAHRIDDVLKRLSGDDDILLVHRGIVSASLQNVEMPV